MSNTIIRVENLGKKYFIGHQKQERYTALRDVIANGAKSVGRRLLKPLGKGSSDPTVEEFWALKDVSFEIQQGDRVGIIGRNGAGKSTLLKILSRITEPTQGSIRIKGRVASLLEVGTGFHPELTGRENIYLNGAILGMSKAEIKRKFDEIVAFAEVEKFLDTPVKRYSSGMYVRLAFAVAAHLEPEILVVDEVLAVGDAQFQKKCLGKMEDVGKEGRTVIFVSHNMIAIQQLCTKCLLLESGKSRKISSVDEVIKLYFFDHKTKKNNNIFEIKRRSGFGKKARVCKLVVLNSHNKELEELNFGETFSIELECRGIEFTKNIQFVIGIDSLSYGRITTLISQESFEVEPDQQKKGKITIDELCLNPGKYMLTVGLRDIDQLIHIKEFQIKEFTENENLLEFKMVNYGCLQLPNAKWEIV